MIIAIKAIVFIALMAFLWRGRGCDFWGLFKDEQNTPSRILWAVGATAAAALIGANWWQMILLAPVYFFTAVLGTGMMLQAFGGATTAKKFDGVLFAFGRMGVPFMLVWLILDLNMGMLPVAALGAGIGYFAAGFQTKFRPGSVAEPLAMGLIATAMVLA